jgi:hypothetical protein
LDECILAPPCSASGPAVACGQINTSRPADRFKMVLVKQGNDWLIAHHHSSLRPPPKQQKDAVAL